MLEHDTNIVAVVDAHCAVLGVVTAADLTLGELTLRLAGVGIPRLRGLWFAPEHLLEILLALACCIPVVPRWLNRTLRNF